jgi:hypothetical protein
VKVSFQYGTTTAYGQATAPQSTGVTNAATPFAALLTGLPAGTTIHYRAVAASDFGTFVGQDETLTTVATPPAPGPGGTPPGAGNALGQTKVSAARASGSTASVRVTCTGPAGATCQLALKLTVTEVLKGHKLVAVTARANGHKTNRVVQVGAANVSLKAGQTQTVRIPLNRTGKRLLVGRHGLKAKLLVSQATGTGLTTTVSSQIVTFKPAKQGRAHRTH